MKQQVNAFDYAGHICESMKKGILLTTKSDGKVNTMTIGCINPASVKVVININTNI